MKFDMVGVIGAGQMGQGIAQVAAQSGCNVVVVDRDIELAKKGLARIQTSLEKLVSKGKIDATAKEQTMARLQSASGYDALSKAQIVIEAATENETLKRDIFAGLSKQLGGGVVLATNTSSISITWLAAAVEKPERVIGMHFMNPVPVMKLVEVIKGVCTDDETYTSVVGLASEMGKEVVTSSDYPGFIVNRILMPMINEASFALMEGVASAEDIDAAMKLGTNQPMGPLTLADFIGLDTCVAILEVMHTRLGDPKYRPCPLLRRLVDAKHLGRKAGRGFYTYS